ncbi:MAG: DUF4197 domain-containing protein [Candidatus Marinimicrobia bacterium]|nr:DUF4197 domain-containing protein [Candidatus Neomarinimicrobiota bacterium]
MKKLLTIFICLSVIVSAQSWKDLKKLSKKAKSELKKATKTKIPFTQEEAAQALKDALNIGVEKGVSVLSIKDGFFKNQKVKIPFPPEAKTISKKLRKMGMGKEVEKVVLSINRAAEDASGSALPIFTSAIKKMSIKDAIGIVKGDSTAGTDYLQKKSASDLETAFSPTIKSSLKKVNATKYWKNVITAYNKIPLVKKMNPNLEIYVTQRTIQGLFSIVEEEEIKIRENPKKRITGLLKKVFGS